MSPTSSIHNSASEQTVTPEMINAAGYEPLIHTMENGFTLPYRRLVANPEKTGPFSLMIFFHGTGSVGSDNFLQMRIPGLPFARYLAKHQLKSIVLFPQCRPKNQWVNVPWSDYSHDLPQVPSEHMAAAMEVIQSTIREYEISPSAVYAGGISMGGYAAWDIVCRMPLTFSGILAICGGGDVKQAHRIRHLRVCDYHGTLDPAVPVARSREMVAALRAFDNDSILYREFPEAGHNVWDAAFADDVALDFIYQPQNRI